MMMRLWATAAAAGDVAFSRCRVALRPTAAAAAAALPPLQQQLPGLPALLHLITRSSSSTSTTHQHQHLQQRLQAAITPDVCGRLATAGYAVVDTLWGSETCAALKAELRGVYDAQLMHLNHTHLVSPGGSSNEEGATVMGASSSRKLLPKQGIQEAELTLDPSGATRGAAPLLAQLDAAAGPVLATLLNLLVAPPGLLRLESHATKLQYNEGGGGCFPMHFDSDASLDGRRVTAIYYLNEAWQPGNGGELRLYPFPAPPVDVAPVADRLVLFASTSMLHRVLPSRVPRSCFTIWLSEGPRRAHGAAAAGTVPPPPPPATAAGAPRDDAASWRFLMQPAVRQHVAKLAHAAEWEQSIIESHPASDETEAALANHRSEVQRIRSALEARLAGPLRDLLAAADVAARLAAADERQQGGGDVSGAAAALPDDDAVDAAFALLRQAATHVKWF